MRESERHSFACVGVDNISSPEKFAVNVRLEGWEPVDIAPKIGNIPAIIENFGGAALYGNNPKFALRELMQNAADAVRALRALNAAGEDEGDIDVALTTADNQCWLHVTDTGIGMSRFVLTSVLLDFGTSLWEEESLRTELPGLAASGFKSVGRFGIGFFSIFMLGSKIAVTTQRFRRAAPDESDQWTLEFDDGLLTRPTLRRASEVELLSKPGTRVSVRLNDDVADRLYKESGQKSRLQAFRRLVVSLCPTLDVKVNVTVNEGTRKTVLTPNDWTRISVGRLLDRTGEWKYWLPNELLDLRDSSGKLFGRIGCARDYCSATVTHRGISAGNVPTLGGVLLGENNSDLARNKSRAIAPKGAWESWAEKWIDCNHECSIDTLINLHPLCADRDLPVYRVADKAFTEAQLERWLQAQEQIKVLEDYPYHESHDDVGEDRFDRELKLHGKVLVLPVSNRALIEPLDFSPIRYSERLEVLLRRVWSGYEEWDEDDAIVGEVGGAEIIRPVTSYRKLPRQ